VGHVERFNPAFIATKNMIEKPMFIKRIVWQSSIPEARTFQ
jgi:hypothetical protein